MKMLSVHIHPYLDENEAAVLLQKTINKPLTGIYSRKEIKNELKIEN
jgi:hypothetical protein